MHSGWYLAALAALWTAPALAQSIDLDTRLALPAAAARSDAQRLFWLRNAGKVARARGDREATLLAWDAALPLAENLHGPDSAEVETVLFELALAHYERGDVARALPLYRRDYELRSRIFGPDSAEALITLSNIAAIYLALDDPGSALPIQRQILAAGTRARGESDHDVLIDRNNLAGTLLRLGQSAEAEREFRAVVALRRGGSEDYGEQGLIAIGNLANLLNATGRSPEVEALLAQNALLPVLRSTDPGDYYHAQRQFLRRNVATAYQQVGRSGDAETLLIPAAARARSGLGPSHPETIDFERDLAEVQLGLAAELREQSPAKFAGKIGEALGHARAAVSGLAARTAALGFTPGDEQAAAGESGLRSLTYAQLAVTLSLAAASADRAGQALLRDEALQAIQLAMDGTASRAVAETAARNAAAGQGLAPLVERRQELADRWAGIEAARTAATADPARAGERAELAAQAGLAERELAAADAELARSFPAYFDLIRPAPLTQAQATALLAPDEALLLVLPTRQSTQVMTVTSDGIAWLGSGLTSGEIGAMVRRLLWDVGGNVEVSPAEEARWADEGRGAYPFDRATAYKLWQALIEPSMSELTGKRHVFVIGAGALSSLPFGLLVTAPPEGDDGDPAALRSTKWFADSAALIQLPSLQSLAFLRKYAPAAVPGAAPGSFLGFGDPALLGRAETRGGRGIGGARRRTGASVSRGTSGTLDMAALRAMVRLPGTAIELEAMRQALSAKPEQLFIGTRATESNFRRADLAGARVIALATHGLMAGELAGSSEPGLVFTPPAVPGESDDGLLTASEIAALRFNAEWVILSACNTAAGDGRSGAPGLSGLARAFFYAGAGSLLASHWPVRDDVAARLTVRSVEIGRDNPDLSRAEALTRAMREIRNSTAADTATDTWAHPNAWAPFTLVGDGAR